MKGRAVLFGGLMLVAAGAGAQGAFSFDDVPLDAEPTVEVNMGPEMLNLLSAAASVPGAPGSLDGVTNVRVLVYENIDESMQEVLSFVDSTATKLDADGWHAVVRVREEGEQVRVYMKPGTNGTLAGITVMVTDSGSREAVFLNVAGAIQPAQLGMIASSIGMNGMLNGVPGFTGAAPAAPKQD
jgi:hypothetical protein